MSPVIVGAATAYTDRGWPAVKATIHIDNKDLNVYYRASQGPLAVSAAPFALNALTPAVKFGHTLHIEPPLTPTEGDILARAQEFLLHRGRYPQPITIEAVTQPPPTPAPADAADRRGVGLFFSGGVDSFYSLLQHQDEITHVIFVHGFDSLLSNPAVRARNVQAMRQAAAELGKPMIEVETNARTQLDTYEGWYHRIAILVQMAIANLLGPQIKKIYSAENFDVYLRWNPDEIARGFTTGGAGLFLDGTECPRVDKTAYIAQSETAMRWLRVCWESQEHALNCGRCEKCVRTMVALQLAGALDRCRTFTRPIDLQRVRYMRFAEFFYFWPEMVAKLEKRDDLPDLAAAISNSIGWATIPDRQWDNLIGGLRQRGDQQELLRIILEHRQRAANMGLSQARAEELCRATQRVLDLEDELAIMKASRSWKLTAPLRHTGLWLRRRR